MNVSGAILKTFRLGKRITQGDMAKRLKVNQSTLSRAEVSTNVPFDILMEMHKNFKEEWEAWVRKPFFAEERALDVPSAFIQIPVVAEVVTESFEFDFEMFPKDMLFLGSKIAAVKLGFDHQFGKAGEFLIVSESRRFPTNAPALIKSNDLVRLEKTSASNMVSAVGLIIGTFKKHSWG